MKVTFLTPIDCFGFDMPDTFPVPHIGSTVKFRGYKDRLETWKVGDLVYSYDADLSTSVCIVCVD